MRSGKVGGLAGIFGRGFGGLIAGRVSGPVNDAVHSIRGLSPLMLRAFVDAYLAEKIGRSIWPSAIVLAAVVITHYVCLAAFSPEHDRILVGLVVLTAYVWSAYASFVGLTACWPHAKLWLLTLLSPGRQARLLIFQWVREQHDDLTGFRSGVLAAFLEQIQRETRLGSEEIAFYLAEDLAPVIVRHVIRRALVLIVPVGAALLYYRRYLYPDIIAAYTTIGPWKLALYPLAAAADTVFGAHLREALQHP